MSEPIDDEELRLEAQLAGLLAKAELLPTSVAEVARLEAELESAVVGEQAVSLPSALRRPAFLDELPTRTVDSLASVAPRSTVEQRETAPETRGDARILPFRAIVTHGTALLLGAAAATLLLAPRPAPTPDRTPLVGGPSSTASHSIATSHSAAAPTPSIGPVHECNGCCAGSACSTAAAEQRECPSGRKCISCKPDNERYRVRLGRLALSEQGRALMDAVPGRQLELCARLGAAELDCAPAHLGDDERWRRMPMTAYAYDLLAGLDLQVRDARTHQLLARWTKPVTIHPNMLCKGLLARLESGTGEPFAATSVFADDSHWVELARGDAVAPLLARGQSIHFTDVTPRLYETRNPGADRFVLAIGPLDKPTAERLRWSVLGAKLQARPWDGADTLGESLPVPAQSQPR